MNQVDQVDGEIRQLLARVGDAAGPARDFADLWDNDVDDEVDDVATTTRSRRPIRQVLVVAIAATLVFVGGVGVAVLTRGPDSPMAQFEEPDVAPPVMDHVPPVDGSRVDGPADSSQPEPAATATFQWNVVIPESSIARSSVHGIVVGPTGFVATGMGFDGRQNQGRVWFTVDGVTWDEPAFDLFDDKVMGMPAATSDAFYVVATTNSDRSDENSNRDAHLYRSVDGRQWTPVGDSWNELPGGSDIGTAGDVLLRTNGLGALETSVDGVEWTPTTFGGSAPILGPIIEPNTGIAAGNRHYLRGFEADVFQIWESTNGTDWTPLPTPPTAGVIAELDGVLTIMSFPRAEECLSNRMRPLDEELDWEVHDEQLWTCESNMTVHQFSAAEQAWSLITAGGPGPSPQIPRLSGLGDIAVAAVLDREQTLTAWTSPAPGRDWQPVPETRVRLRHGGGPQPGQIAGTPELVVIATANDGGETTRLIVGSRNP